MKKIYLLPLLLFFLLAYSPVVFSQKFMEMMEDHNVNYYDVIKEAEVYFTTNSKGRGTGYVQFKRWEYYMAQHIDEKGNRIPLDVEYAEIQRANVKIAEIQKASRTSGAPANWTEVGPTSWSPSGGWNPGIGRLEAIRIDAKDQQNIYVGAPGGGLWKSRNGGGTWKNCSDLLPPDAQFVWSIGFADGSPDSVYFGNQSGLVYYSRDGGSTFKSSAIGSGFVRRLIVNPNDHKIVIAATTSGIYKSTNSGVSFTQVKSGNYQDAEFKPDDPSIVYAVGTTFVRSSDGGTTFQDITMGTTNGKRVAVTVANPNYVYVAELKGQGSGNVYRSTDAGNTFTTRLTGGSAGACFGGYESTGSDCAGGQGAYNFALAVSPTNAEEVHVAFIITWKSTNGGTSFVATTDWDYPNTLGYTHCDMHQLEYAGNTLYTGSDGGIYKSTNAGDDFTDISKGLGIRMYYNIGCSATDPKIVGGGAQDNGCNIYNGTKWLDWTGADGMMTTIDWSNAKIIYGSSQNGKLYKTTDGGATKATIASPSGGGWVTPMAQDTKNPNTLFTAPNELHKSTNGGTSWTKVTSLGITINNIEVAPSDNNYVYIAAATKLYVSKDNGSTWNSIATGISGSVKQIAVSPKDPQKVYIATSTGAFVSTDAGSTWTNITGTLPNVGGNAIAVDDAVNEGVYIGMKYAVYYRDKTMADWVLYSDGLPNVAINQLEYTKIADKIRVATYGRGIFETPLYGIVNAVDQSISDISDINIYPNPSYNGVIELMFDSPDENNSLLEVRNAIGQLVYEKTINISKDGFKQSVDLSKYGKGLFVLSLSKSSAKRVKKIVVY